MALAGWKVVQARCFAVAMPALAGTTVSRLLRLLVATGRPLPAEAKPESTEKSRSLRPDSFDSVVAAKMIQSYALRALGIIQLRYKITGFG
jgi:hypothetical protein